MNSCPDTKLPSAARMNSCPDTKLPSAARMNSCPDTKFPSAARMNSCPDTKLPSAARMNSCPDTKLPSAARMNSCPDTKLPLLAPAEGNQALENSLISADLPSLGQLRQRDEIHSSRATGTPPAHCCSSKSNCLHLQTCLCSSALYLLLD